MSSTRTGSFPIGFRRGRSEWQKQLGNVINWAKDNGFECLDVGRDVEAAKQVVDAGLKLGSVDLLEWKEMIYADAEKRKTALAHNTKFVEQAAAVGARHFFIVMMPADAHLKREENYEHMVAGFKPLMQVLEEHDACIVIEGYPGPGALCCTPETLRPFLDAMDSSGAAVNYDPSHLIRMGVDPLRFLREFVADVRHVHAKDTEILHERQYELGIEQRAALTAGIGFGGNHWRYTIPGHGVMRWVQAFRMLVDAGYEGCVSIELEDANFNGTDAGERRGLLLSRHYLEGC